MARAGEASRVPGVFAECLIALGRDADGIDGQAGAYVLAETVLMIRSALTKK